MADFGGELHIKYTPATQPGTVTVVTVEDRVASEAARDQAQASAAQAAASAGTFTAPADSVIAGLVGNGASAVATAISTKIAAEVPTPPPAPGSLSGTYAARPAANTVEAGTVYYATDVPEAYRSNGTAWVVVQAGGNEIGYAATTAAFTSPSAAKVDVPGLTTSFVVGERPVAISMQLEFRANAAGAFGRAFIFLDGTEIAHMGGIFNSANFMSFSRTVRKSGLTPGSSHTAKVMVEVVIGATTISTTSVANDPHSISVVTL